MLTLFAQSLALIGFGARRILRGNPQDEGFVWLLTGIAFFGTLVWAFPRVVRARAAQPRLLPVRAVPVRPAPRLISSARARMN
ncbi:MAG TPA: hypothetical protein VGR64_02935 [Terracidiphilus sp.]|nr:hypothetical protein [Terracidiphilus sp.]